MNRSWLRNQGAHDAANAEERLVAIVDDDASVRQLAGRLIPSLGYRAEKFGSAEEFLASGQTTKTACLVWHGRMPPYGRPGTAVSSGGQRPADPQSCSSPPGPARRRSDGDSGRARSRVPAKLVDNDSLLGIATTVLERSVSGGENRDDD